MVKKRAIEERLEAQAKRLANAEAYVARGVNVRSTSWLHLSDWNGQSGHPLWMKNKMIPSTRKTLAKLEATVDRIAAKEKDRSSHKRRPSKSRR